MGRSRCGSWGVVEGDGDVAPPAGGATGEFSFPGVLDGEHAGKWRVVPRGRDLLRQVAREWRIGKRDVICMRREPRDEPNCIGTADVGVLLRAERGNVRAQGAQRIRMRLDKGGMRRAA